MRIKRILSLLLVVAMLLSMATFFAQAANTPEEALGEVNVINGGQSLNCLAVNGRVQELNYVYYRYVGVAGTREIPAYCVNPTDPGVPQKVPAGQSIAYMAKDRASDPKIMGIVSNGYPTKSLGELGLQNKIEGYYATKIALWCYIIPGWNISAVTINPSLTGDARTQAQRVLAAAKKIYQNGSWWTEIPTAGLTTTADREYAYPVTIDGKAYKQQIFTVHSETWVCNYAVNVAFADPGAVPAGTRIVNLENQDITVVTTKNTGKGYDGQFKVLYPADSITGKSGSVQFALRAQVYQHGVYYAACAEVSKYGKVQNYICDTDPTRNTDLSAVSKYGAGSTPDTPDTGLEIIKVEEGTGACLAGAVFEVKGPKGNVVGSFSSGNDGRVVLPLAESGTYAVTEVTPPKNHLLSANPTQTVTVSYGEIATVTFENAPYGNLRVEKRSDTGDVLAGVAVQVKHIESGATYSQKTGPGGAAVFAQLKPGAYEVRELAGIPGWKADTDTVKTVSVSTGKTSVVTLKNKELPGLRILKYDRKSMTVMPNVSFEVFRDTVSLGIYQTDQMGEIFLSDLEPGTYRVEERHSDDAHILDVLPQEIELTAGGGIRQLVFFNSKRPGLHLVKVDSADPSKVIPNAVFEIKAVDGSYGPKEFTTLADGSMDLSKLEPGAYVVTEKSCNGYVIDDAQRILQLSPDMTGEFVFTNSIKPSLRLVKYSADGTPLEGVSYRIARIADGSRYLDRTTNGQGEVLVSNLEPGVYSVRETATTADHILDVKEYHVELFPGKTSTLIVENQKRPNLIVYKHDADTGDPIANTVFEVRAADGHSVDQIRTDKDGRAELKNLLPGVYEITEKSVPSPYLLDAPKQLATLYPNRDHTVYFENHKRPSLTVQKVDNMGRPIKGAKFQVWYASNHTTNGELNDLGTFYSDENGQFALNNLRDGWYKVIELEPAAGFVLQEPTTQEIFIAANESKILTFENVPIGGVEIIKVNEANKAQRLAGATFEIRKSDDTLVDTVTTDQAGHVYVPLEAGSYFAVEIEAPKGHKLDPTPHYFTVKDGRNTTLTVANRAFSGILIHKIDAGTKKGIYGVTFLLYDSGKNPIGQYTSDQRGYVHIDDLTESGRYYLRELENEGYIVDEQMKTVYVKSGQTTEITWKNTAITAQIQIVKKSADYNPTNGLPAGTLLEGAVFEVCNERTGNKMDTIVSNANGLAVSRQLPLGRYIIREVKAPAHYMVNDTFMTAVLEYSGQIIRFEVINQSAVPGVSITKTGPKEVVSRQPVRYVFSGVANTGNVTLESFYWRDNLPAAVTLDKVMTGSYNRPGSYKVVYKVNNVGNYHTLADNLSTAKSYTLDARPVTLGLAANEQITEIMFIFGQAPAGFAQVEAPMLYCTAGTGLGAGGSFTNTADAGGIYNGAWIQAVTRWTTSVYGKPTPLPRTGY